MSRADDVKRAIALMDEFAGSNGTLSDLISEAFADVRREAFVAADKECIRLSGVASRACRRESFRSAAAAIRALAKESAK